MKLSTVAAAVAALLATDAKPTEAQIMAACLAADKKGKDEGGLGPVELQNKAKDEKEAAKDAAAEFYGNTKDEWEKMDKGAKDKARDEFKEKAEDKAKDADVDANAEDENETPQPKKSANGNLGNGGAEPAKDTAAVIQAALDARDALHAARIDVQPVLGVVTYDSAAAVYGAALKKLGIDTKGVHASAFSQLYRLAVDRAVAQTPSIASDSASIKTMSTLIKGYDRLR
jgi:hypothetical protein